MPTIGVSVPVPDPWGSRLQAYRVGLGDHQARGIPSHITLLPPYELKEGEYDDLIDQLSYCASSTPAFDVRLLGTGTFRPVSPVVFINVVAGISVFETLVSHCHRGPARPETRFPYHPHVTVAHGLDDALLDRAYDELADFRADFRVDALWMYRHDVAHGWNPERSFPLAP